LLPQTHQRPSTATHAFHAEMAALWRAIRTGQDRPARRAFFPEGAYVQVKAIPDARGDYRNRLLADYDLDIAAAHALVRPGATLVAVNVPDANIHWVPLHACYNRVGYYEVPNARIVYRQGGSTSSFGIASMISWRGVWYVVHLGAVVRHTATGIVDDPSSGAGTSAASLTC
jgi:hypothetical protein